MSPSFGFRGDTRPSRRLPSPAPCEVRGSLWQHELPQLHGGLEADLSFSRAQTLSTMTNFTQHVGGALSTCPPTGRVTLPLEAPEVAEDSGGGPVPSTRPLFSGLVCKTRCPSSPVTQAPGTGRGLCQPWSLSGGWSWAQAFGPSHCWGRNKSDGQPCLPVPAPLTRLTGRGCPSQDQTGSVLSDAGARGRVPTEGTPPILMEPDIH